MNTILLLHHYLFLFIVFLLLIIILFLFKKKKILSQKLSSLLVYTIHLQTAFGLILLIKNFFFLIKNQISIFDILKINYLRYKFIEHPLIMLLVVIMTTLVNMKLKRKNQINYKITLIYSLILILLLSRTPIHRFF